MLTSRDSSSTLQPGSMKGSGADGGAVGSTFGLAAGFLAADFLATGFLAAGFFVFFAAFPTDFFGFLAVFFAADLLVAVGRAVFREAFLDGFRARERAAFFAGFLFFFATLVLLFAGRAGDRIIQFHSCRIETKGAS